MGALGTSRTVTLTSAGSLPLMFWAVVVMIPLSFLVAALTISLVLYEVVVIFIFSVTVIPSDLMSHFLSGAGSPLTLTSNVKDSPALHLTSFRLVLSILGGTFLALQVTGPASLEGLL